MPLEMVLSPDRRYLTLRADGETSIADLESILGQAVQVCRAASVARVLVDIRRMRTVFSRLDLLNLASRLPTAGFLPGTRFAVLIELESPEIRYFEQVASSRGALVDHYQHFEEALEVLLAPAFG